MSKIRPLWIISLCFTIGIGLTRILPNISVYLLSCLLILSWSIWGILKKSSNVTILTLLTCLTFSLAGTWWAAIKHHQLSKPNRLRSLYIAGKINNIEPVELTGYLSNWPELAPNYAYIEIDSEEINTGLEKFRARGLIKIMMNKPDQVASLNTIIPKAKIQVLVIPNRESRFQNPGGTDLSEYLDVQGYDLTGIAKSPIQQLEIRKETGFISRIGLLKIRALNLIQHEFNPNIAGILIASVLGNGHFLNPELSEIFKKTGTFHLLIISGSHLAFLGWLISFLLLKLTKKRFIVTLVLLGSIWMYTVFVGTNPPVLRAAIALTVWQILSLFYRKPDALNVLGIAILIILTINPLQLFDPSFQLTMTAVLVLIGGVVPLLKKLEEIGSWHLTPKTPRPPYCPKIVRRFAESLYWSPRKFADKMSSSPLTYSLDKTQIAYLLENCGFTTKWIEKYPWFRNVNLQIALRFGFVLFLSSSAVQIAMLPLSSYYFNRVTPIGIVSNILAELAMSCLMISTVMYFIANLAGPNITSIFSWITKKVSLLLISAAKIGNLYPWSSWRLPHLEGNYILIYGLYLVAVASLLIKINRWQPFVTPKITHKYFRFLVTIIVLMVFISSGYVILATPNQLISPKKNWMRITFIDVGQGDSALLEFPDGKTMLIDSGGQTRYATTSNSPSFMSFEPETKLGIGEKVVSRLLWARNVKRLDVIVGTHPDADHVQAFSEIIKNFPVGQAYCSQQIIPDQTFKTWIQVLENAHIPINVLSAENSLSFGDVKVEVLSPKTNNSNLTQKSDNNNSLVLKVSYGKKSFLFTGDIETEAESNLVTSKSMLECNVLKAPHHGSRTSSTEDFIKATHPEYVIFSAPKKSPYGHPHFQVVERYKNLISKSQLLQTGINGAITFETNGQELQMTTYKN